jgi:TolA-binding protein
MTRMKTVFYFISILTLLLYSCGSKKSPEELMTEASTFTQEKKFPESVNAYETIINDFPDDSLAPEATFNLATLYQNKSVKNLTEEESLWKAVELFQSIHKKYPNSSKAPMGLFMSGFILANELKDYNSATDVYNLFLKEYPDNELATSTKEELDNMGLTPEEILQKKIARQE